jgi:hypothetical protein
MQHFELQRLPPLQDDLLQKFKDFIQSVPGHLTTAECGTGKLDFFHIYDIPKFPGMSFRFSRIDSKPNNIFCEIIDESRTASLQKLDQSRDQFFSGLLNMYMDAHRGESFRYGATGTLD